MTAYRRGRNELVVGLTAVASIAVFVVMFAALTSRGVIRWSSDLHILLPTAEGLLKGDAVLFRGVPVGEVREIGFADEHVMVRAKIHRPVPLTESAEATLAPVDMFGRQAIVLQPGQGAGPPLADGDTLSGRETDRLTDRIDGVGRQVEKLLGDSTLGLLHEALAGVERAGAGVSATGSQIAGFLAEHRRQLRDVSDAMETVARNVAAATDSADVVRIRGELEGALASLSSATARMDTAGAAAVRILARLDRGEGSVGRILSDPLLYERATAAIGELELLIRDVRADPGRFVTLSVF